MKTKTLATGMAWHAYVDGHRQMEIFRNPRRHQHAGSRYILYRCSNSSADGFQTWESAKAYATELNPKVEWRLEPFEG